jgi:hypothetical protein
VSPEEAYSKAIQKDGLVESLHAAGVNWQPGVVGQAPLPPSPVTVASAEAPADMTPVQGTPHAAAPAAAPAAYPAPALPRTEAPSAEPPEEGQPLEDPFEQYKRQRG